MTSASTRSGSFNDLHKIGFHSSLPNLDQLENQENFNNQNAHGVNINSCFTLYKYTNFLIHSADQLSR